ncbi:MAG: hypothetical protein RIB65_16695 [Ilumatobacter fluminis]|uniref:hypothetical protein n=1 Tax=Ilumatobacter fluminis TaxID=467091 RepID=UPI0032EE1016
MDEGLDDHVRALFATAPDEFVAARTELVKALKRDDRRDDAATIAGLRRPSWIDGALNRTAAAEPEPVAEFVDAAQAARRIQQADAEGRRTASLADALRTVRAAQARLAKVADSALVGFGRKADLAGVTARLAQLGADPVGLELLRGGVLGIGDELAGVLVTDDTGEPGVTSDTGKSGDTGAPNADDDAARRKAIDAATRAARSAEKDAQVAATAARRAAERRDRAAAAAVAAEAAVRDAERALEQARSELAEHQTRAADAERAADEAAEAASVAAARLDDLLD